jgi:hypothetical protein
MKLLHLILRVLINAYFSSADPNLFGNTKRRKAKNAIAAEYMKRANETQTLIDEAQTGNPFESAGAKAAMEKASSGATRMQTRMLNTMGSNASPEALISAQGATNEALGSTAGQIAVGAEANKDNKINNLRGIMNSQYDNSLMARMDAIDEMGKRKMGAGTGSGIAGAASNVAQAIISKKSDERLKENIKKIGEIQGHNIYKFNYKGEEEITIGVIAQELEGTEYSDCIVPVGNYLSVNYDKLFKEV